MGTAAIASTGVGKIVEYRPPQAHHDWTATMGMVMFLASWAMLFAALFFVYGGVRARAHVWPPVDVPHLPLGLPGINTVVVGLSSALYVWGVRSIRAHQPRRLTWALAGVTLLGCVFMGLQLWVWRDLAAQGLSPSTGTYGSVFYGLTWVHAAHVLVGIVAVACLTLRSYLGAYHAARHGGVRLWGMYWHFVGVIWALMYLTVYVF